MDHIVYDPALTQSDLLVLQNLVSDIKTFDSSRKDSTSAANGNGSGNHVNGNGNDKVNHDNESTIKALAGLNNPKDVAFTPTVFTSVDLDYFKLYPQLRAWFLQPYIRFASSIVRVETDVVMFTHLLLYFTTSLPSALYLFYNFSWLHGVIHFVMQFLYMGPYTLMMHQHIHMRGVLNKKFWLFDLYFPYITDPLMGHTWNTYFYHHVKHHHVEGNGPEDLSSTLVYERDNIWHFLHYVGRFLFLIWVDLPMYFLRKGKTGLAFRAAFWELSNYTMLITLFRINPRATFCVLLLPLMLMRLGLMIGNWGQHAFVDKDEPDSDYRSSITLIDVASNRFCFNDGYHTSHHLNPLRHWRDHPVAFVKGKDAYASQHALVFHNIDYLMMTVRLMMRDYKTLAKCMVPLGEQISLTMEEREALLKSHTRPFTKEQIRAKFKQT